MDVLAQLGFAIVAVPLTAAITWVGRWLYEQRRARRLWLLRRLLRSANDLNVIVSDSAAVHTGRYLRRSTGLGQARAIGLLSPSLSHAYKGLPTEFVKLSSDCVGDDRCGDVVILGGPKNNSVTRLLFERLGSRYPVSMITSAGDDAIVWRDHGVEEHFPDRNPPPLSHGGKDFGLILRTNNCFDETGTVTLFAGTHTYGTLAAALFFVRHPKRILELGPEEFAIVVECNVEPDGHVERPHCIRSTTIPQLK
jgi:hypothetical protein